MAVTVTLYGTFSLAWMPTYCTLPSFTHDAAAFVERVGAGDLVPIFLNDDLDAGRAALLFVVGGQEDDVAAPAARRCA